VEFTLSDERGLPTNSRRIAVSDISGHGNLLAVTANYRLEQRGRVLGTYLIGGGGWYFREASLSKPVPVGTSITCDRTWLWWGYNCQSGTVITNLTLASSSSNSWGCERGYRLHGAGGRGAVQVLRRVTLSLRANQEYQHSIGSDHHRNSVLDTVSCLLPPFSVALRTLSSVIEG